MNGPLFEQYKSALRRGHVAALAGKLDDALDAYREAARLVPERSLPLACQGTVLHRLGRWEDANAAFDAALQLAPDDETTLRARSATREERGLRSEAAADFERLAMALDAAGRTADAAEAVRRADELEGSSARTALLARLAEPTFAASPSAMPPAAAEAPAPASTTAAPDGAANRIVPETAAEAARAANAVDPATEWPPLDLPTLPPLIVGPSPDPETLLTNATVLLDAGELSAARDLMLSAALIHRQLGRLDAALDVCFQLLEIDPGDAQVHVAIANVQLDREWTPVAIEKIHLLRELTSLTGDSQGAADVQFLATERLRDVPTRTAAAGAAPAK